MTVNLVYITAGDLDEARSIGKSLVSERLAACVNIIDNMRSLYWWDGAIQDEKEVVLFAKTREGLVSRLIEKVKSEHSYDCPCIVTVPISDGNRAFLDWVEKETTPRAPD